MVGVSAVISDPRLGAHPPPGPTPFFVYIITSMAVIGGFLFGYDCGVVAGALVILKVQKGWEEVNENVLWQELIVSVTVGAAAVFSAIGGPLNDKYGRKPITLVASALFTIGAIIMAFSPGKELLLVGRIVVGSAIGLSSTTVPAYVAESSPPNVRGRLITMFQLLITLGFWVAGLLDAAFSYLPGWIAWRLMLGVAGIPAFIQFVGFFFMPESPRWLATHGREAEAHKVLLKVCSTKEMADWELKSIELSHKETEKNLKEKGGHHPFIIMITDPALRRALIVGCILQMFQQVCGINTVMYYSTTIIQMAGVRNVHIAIWLTAVTSGFNFFCTFLGIYLVEKIGRRLLVLGSTLAVILCLLLLGVGFVLIANDAPKHSLNTTLDMSYDGFIGNCGNSTNCDGCSYNSKCGFCFDENDEKTTGVCILADKNQPLFSINGSGRCSAEYSKNPNNMIFANGWCPSKYAFLPVVAMVLYLCAFSCGLGPMPWTINAEIYPHFARSTGNACATATNWAFNLIIAQTFLTLADAITRQGAFFLYAGITTLGWIIFYCIVRETKDKTLEELEDLYSRPWFGKQKTDKIVPSRDISESAIDYIKIPGDVSSLTPSFDRPASFAHQKENYNSIPSSENNFDSRKGDINL